MFFGAQEYLYGVYHAVADGSARGAVLMCPAVGSEYMRTHRAFRQIADQLACDGYSVLRFDYSCTGNSAGDHEHASWQNWIEDTRVAGQKLRELSGIEKLSVLGLRLGATLACEAFHVQPLAQLYLWDPVIIGTDFLRDLDNQHERLREQLGCQSGQDSDTRSDVQTVDWIDRAGCVFSKKLLHDIAARDMTDYALRNKKRVSVLVSKGLGLHNRMLSRWGTGTSIQLHLTEREEAGIWSKELSEAALLSAELVDVVVADIGVEA